MKVCTRIINKKRGYESVIVLIKQCLEGKRSENLAKPKQLWQTLKLLGLPNKKNYPSNICLKNKNGLSFDSLTTAETFNKYYSSLAENLVLKLPKPPNNFEI